jgi:hypothetical protein
MVELDTRDLMLALGQISLPAAAAAGQVPLVQAQEITPVLMVAMGRHPAILVVA